MAKLPKKFPQLHQIIWHDMPISSIGIDIMSQHVSLVLTPYEEKSATHGRVAVSFSEVSNLEMQLSALINESGGDDLEVYSLEVTEANERYKAQLTLLADHGPSNVIRFDFRSVTVS